MASLAVLTWGCTNEPEQVVDQEPSAVEVVEEPTVTLEFTAGFEGTKTALDDTHVLWEAGDQIVLIPMKYTNSSFADDDTWTSWYNDTGKTTLSERNDYFRIRDFVRRPDCWRV